MQVSEGGGEEDRLSELAGQGVGGRVLCSHSQNQQHDRFQRKRKTKLRFAVRCRFTEADTLKYLVMCVVGCWNETVPRGTHFWRLTFTEPKNQEKAHPPDYVFSNRNPESE